MGGATMPDPPSVLGADVAKIAMVESGGTSRGGHVTRYAAPMPQATVAPYGNMRRVCGGRFLLGPSRGYLATTHVILAGFGLLFVCYTNCVPAARVAATLLVAMAMCLLWACALTDPGAVTRQPPPSPGTSPSRSMWVTVSYTDARSRCARTALIERRWCYSCNVVRPLRSTHCCVCDVCVVRRDHHCPWTGTCIGERNYRFYCGFLLATVALTATGLFGSIASLIERRRRHVATGSPGPHLESAAWFLALADTYFLELLLALVALVGLVFTGTLLVVHTYLVVTNMTMGEEQRRSSTTVNVYDTGSWWGNAATVLCPMRHRAWADDSAHVVVESGEAADEEPIRDAAPAPPSAQAAHDRDGSRERQPPAP